MKKAIYLSTQKRKISNETLALLIQEWVNHPKPSVYEFGHRYNIHPRTVYRLINQHYKGKVINGITITLQSAINVPYEEEIFSTEAIPVIDKEKFVISTFRSNPNLALKEIANITKTSLFHVHKYLTNALERKEDHAA